jgi:hypothetical protein
MKVYLVISGAGCHNHKKYILRPAIFHTLQSNHLGSIIIMVLNGPFEVIQKVNY